RHVFCTTTPPPPPPTLFPYTTLFRSRRGRQCPCSLVDPITGACSRGPRNTRGGRWAAVEGGARRRSRRARSDDCNGATTIDIGLLPAQGRDCSRNGTRRAPAVNDERRDGGVAAVRVSVPASMAHRIRRSSYFSRPFTTTGLSSTVTEAPPSCPE